MTDFSTSTVTLHQVAEAAGVSAATVSRILNGTATVSKTKREAVEKAIAELGFRPNPIAQGLARGRSMSIGVLTEAITNPFFMEALKGIEDVLQAGGYAPLFASCDWFAPDEDERLQMLVRRRVDGIILIGGNSPSEHLVNLATHTPLVVFGRDLSRHGISSLIFDNEDGAYHATQHLIAMGHRHIAHITGPADHTDSQARLAGYQRALAEAKLSFDPQLVVAGDFHEPSGLAAAYQLFSRTDKFTAIFAANDQMAYGARLHCYRNHIRVPEDISLIGFDDIPGSLYTTPPLTSVKQPMYEVGQACAQAMMTILQHQSPALSTLKLHLVARDSCAAPRNP